VQWWEAGWRAARAGFRSFPYFAVAGWALLVALYGDVSLGHGR